MYYPKGTKKVRIKRTRVGIKRTFVDAPENPKVLPKPIDYGSAYSKKSYSAAVNVLKKMVQKKCPAFFENAEHGE